MELNSEDHFKNKSEEERARLLGYKQSGLKKARIVSVGGCQACIKLTGKVMVIDDALKEMPIPVKDCTFNLHGKVPGWCRCRYVAYFDDPKLDTPDSFYEEQKRNARGQLKMVVK